MSMGYDACFADVIEEKAVAKIINNSDLVGNFINEFNNLINNDESEYTPLELATLLNDNDNSLSGTDILKLWQEICSQFHMATKLHLYVSYHNAEKEGDIYDEVDGLYFHISTEELYEPSPAYKALTEKFGNVIQRSFYVYFG